MEGLARGAAHRRFASRGASRVLVAVVLVVWHAADAGMATSAGTAHRESHTMGFAEEVRQC